MQFLHVPPNHIISPMFPADSTLVDLLQHRATHQPQQLSYVFLTNGETEEITLSYQTLTEKVMAIAAQLQAMNLQNERALLLYAPGLDFVTAFLGCLAAGVGAVPVYPPQGKQPLSRLEAIAADAEAKIVLTTNNFLAKIKQYFSETARFTYLTTDSLDESLALQWKQPNINSKTLAFLQYTSGSTGNPKGVMVSHGNLLQNSANIYRGFKHNDNSRVVSWLPHYHDMGLIGGILQPLYGGFPVILMSPSSFIRKPIRWLRAISRYGATTSGGPNFAYKRCVETITPKQKAGLDLSSWKIAFTGAESISSETLDQFAEAFAPCGFRREAFYPCYGLAEATLFVTGKVLTKSELRSQNSEVREPNLIRVDSEALQQNRVVVTIDETVKTQKIVSCGQPTSDETVIIVDPETLLPCSPEKVGEIWVSGASVAQGYWQQKEITEATFKAYLADTKEGTFLRTGDLGFLHDGELFVTGRLKDVIIIRGHNYYPQDIELTVENSHPAIRPNNCVATSITHEEEEKLLIIAEIKRKFLQKLNLEETITKIRANISQNHGIQTDNIVLVKQGSIPKTSSGKIQRQACKQAYLEQNLPTIESLQVFKSSPHAPSNLIQWLRNYANEHINSRLMDERRCIPPHIVLDFGNQGLLGMQVPPEYGGLGLNHGETMKVIEQLGAIDTTLSLFVGLNNILGIRPLLQFGSQALKEELLPMLATGRELAAFALTEPSAGSNPQAITSSAMPLSSDKWVLNGTKIWSGSAAWAGVINVFVQQKDAQGKFQGISSFAVRRGTPGLKQGPEALTLGMRGMVQNTVYLNNVPVSASQQLGDPGEGMKVAQDAMMYGRLAIAAASVGGMKRCAQLWHRYSSRRQISTGRLLDNPLVLARLNGLTAAITTVETLVTSIAQLLDQGQEVPIEAYTVCKMAAPEFYWQAADNLVQFLGGRGYIETNIAPQILRDARVLRIFEGPTETLTAFLGSRLIYQPKGLKRLLRDTLGVPEIYEQLQQTVEQIQYYRKSPFTEATKTKHWTAMLCGEVAMWGVLLAVLQAKAIATPLESLDRAIAWTKEHFQQKIAQGFIKTPDELVISSANKTTELIADYETAIGDIEQTLAGEDRELDELLRKQKNGEIREYSAVKKIERAEKPLSEEDWEKRGVIEDWLKNWLGKKLNLSPQTIDPKRAFADYGIDSVMAVELAQDLQEWLGHTQELEASLAWNFPNIKSLAKYLTTVASVAEDEAVEEILSMAEPEMMSAIKNASEEEIQTAISQEMAELESLLKGGYQR
ncbi:AMP-dependent synthetase and ligase, probable acyl-CoA synthase [Crocosphaera subtropica ATCC 51142]|uniref:AMP-dependent synthetase and ligase, probable acyl-CoA synthase n=2 Tax=Crocosphaera TaxID=263510 RepID=B1WWV6_CROS5|nr:AMP-dependent synthetase and ligase, probable acyl-CoA synthase [Crocosphaera subtropica ATCC 51142]